MSRLNTYFNFKFEKYKFISVKIRVQFDSQLQPDFDLILSKANLVTHSNKSYDSNSSRQTHPLFYMEYMNFAFICLYF